MLLVIVFIYLFLFFQLKGIIGEFGLVVISRNGYNADKFLYESDKLFPLKVRQPYNLACKQKSNDHNREQILLTITIVVIISFYCFKC